MAELRYNPLLGTWTMVASSRQARPHLPKDFCPFCPGSGKVPDSYDVWKYDNDFPVLSPDPSAPDPVATGFYRTAPSAGKCEVILYSPDHRASLCALSVGHIGKLVNLWAERSAELAKDPRVKCVFPFENRGEEVGVTMPHPHGQIYAYPFVPQKLEIELTNARKHYESSGECLLCRMNDEEEAFGARIIHENLHFTAYLPFFTDYPYGVFIVSNTHLARIEDFTSAEREALAETLQYVTGAFDMLFDRPFPYMMCVHQAPVNSPELGEVEKYFHFHIEFYPPLRARDRQKFYASSEMGMWAAANVAAVEETAAELRAAKYRHLAATDRARLLAELKNEFYADFGKGGFRIFRAPGRVNLIGEHIDYNGGMVLPAAIDLDTFVLIRPRPDTLCILRSLNLPGVHGFEAGTTYAHAPDPVRWADYPLGVLQALANEGKVIPTGFDALVFSSVPSGAGLSSSAAIETAFATAIAGLFGFQLARKEIALLGRTAENDFVGVPCGIMDQYASACGKAGHAMLLDCASVTHRDIPADFGDASLVIVNTNQKRRLAESKYSERLAECGRALAAIRNTRNIGALCELAPAEFAQLESSIADPVARKRARHAVTENARVLESVDELSRGDLAGFGRLLYASHESLRGDYEVTGPQLDAVIEIAREMPFVYGARMTGAGFGGCAVALVKTDAVAEFKARMTAGYREKTGLYPSFYLCRIANGAEEVSE